MFSTLRRNPQSFVMPTDDQMEVGVFCHMYYRAMFEQFERHLRNLPRSATLHLSTCSIEDANILRAMFGDWPSVEVRVVANRGRDLAPRLVTFAQSHARYDCVLYLHTKGSIPEWRDHLLKHLIGSRRVVAKVLAQFERDPRLGILAAPHYPPIRPWIHWGPNKPLAIKLAERMGIAQAKLDGAIDFPAGSMFWARPAALAPLLGLGLTTEDFPEEGGQTDGTIAHAIERLFYPAAEHAGLTWRTVPLRRSLLEWFRRPSEALLRTRRLADQERASHQVAS